MVNPGMADAKSGMGGGTVIGWMHTPVFFSNSFGIAIKTGRR
jgi:hypothetical protein